MDIIQFKDLMIQDKIKARNSFKMPFPQYLNGIINHHSKHKQVQQIKEEIKKMLPFPLIHSEEKQSTVRNNSKHNNERKTVSNFFPQPTSKIFLSLQTRPAFYSSTQKDFRPIRFNKKQSSPMKLPQEEQQNSNDEEQQSMKQWRQQMMKHIKPKKDIQYKTIETQTKVIEKQKEVEKEFLSSNLSKMKTAPSHLKKKQRSTTKPFTKPLFVRTQGLNQKNIILIKPTIIQDQKPASKNKIQPLKLKKTLTFDKFYNNNIYDQKDSDELTLQKIANFEALLPFLGAKKAKVQKKQQKKEGLYELRLSLQQQAKKKKVIKQKQSQFKQKITGWQTNYD